MFWIMPHVLTEQVVEREFICFRSIYYEIDLKSISDDFPEELTDTCGSVCRECNVIEVEGRGLSPCSTCVHSIVEASGEDWTERYKRNCYFCMKPMFEERPIQNCVSCQTDEANFQRGHLACVWKYLFWVQSSWIFCYWSSCSLKKLTWPSLTTVGIIICTAGLRSVIVFKISNKCLLSPMLAIFLKYTSCRLLRGRRHTLLLAIRARLVPLVSKQNMLVLLIRHPVLLF